MQLFRAYCDEAMARQPVHAVQGVSAESFARFCADLGLFVRQRISKAVALQVFSQCAVLSTERVPAMPTAGTIRVARSKPAAYLRERDFVEALARLGVIAYGHLGEADAALELCADVLHVAKARRALRPWA